MSAQDNNETRLALLEERFKTMEKRIEKMETSVDKLLELRWKIFGAILAGMLLTSSVGSGIIKALFG